MTNPKFTGSFHLLLLDNDPSPVKASLTLTQESDKVVALVKVTNILRGSLEFTEERLTGALVSTMAMGSDDEAMVELAFTNGFQSGFGVLCVDDKLTLTGEHNTLTFKRDLSVERLFGEYILLSYNEELLSLSEELRLTFVSAVPGTVATIAQFTNSVRGELRLEDDMLQGVMTTTMETSSEVKEEMEEKFAAGMERGMAVTFDGEYLTLKGDECVFKYAASLRAKDLIGEYVLRFFNGSPPDSRSQVTLDLTHDEFGHGVVVRATVFNTFNGSATIIRRKLKGSLSSSDEPGTDAEALIEEALQSGFMKGFLCIPEGEQLTLQNDDTTFIFAKVPCIEYKSGKPTYRGMNITGCFKEHDNGLLFRIINSDEGKWAFYNDATRYNMHVKVTFGSRSRVEALQNTRIDVNEDGKSVAEVVVAPCSTEMFIAGHVNGYACSYDALPI